MRASILILSGAFAVLGMAAASHSEYAAAAVGLAVAVAGLVLVRRI